MQANCMKCREKVEIKNPKAITMKNDVRRPKANARGVEPRYIELASDERG